MWNTIAKDLFSENPLSAFFYLVVGAVLGSLISVGYGIRAQRPRLLVSGGGGGGNQDRQRWNIAISNRPSFFGVNLDGEPARDLTAWIRLNETGSPLYMLYWDGVTGEQQATIEAGQQRPLNLFHWRKSEPGYVVVDAAGDPVARFESRNLAFVLRLSDRLGRMTEFQLRVEFDGSHLKQTPRLTIVAPVTTADRIGRIRVGLRFIKSAFRRN